MPLSLPAIPMTPAHLDQVLAAGYRRSGSFFYRTQCPSCAACEPVRIAVEQFAPSRSQKRTLKKGNSELEVRIAPPQVDSHRIALFNLHRSLRELDHGNPPAGWSDYQSFLLNSPCDVLELSLWHRSELIAVSVTDVGASSLSAVYCFFDPAQEKLSPGTFAILKQLELARALGCQWLYLGLYVEQNAHLNYKAKFRPQQRLIDGRWVDFT